MRSGKCDCVIVQVRIACGRNVRELFPRCVLASWFVCISFVNSQKSECKVASVIARLCGFIAIDFDSGTPIVLCKCRALLRRAQQVPSG